MNRRKLQGKLALLAYPSELDNDGELKPDFEDILDEAERMRVEVISPIFNNRFVTSMFESEFNVYCASREDAKSVVDQAIQMGYKNVYTFVPKVQDPSDAKCSINDPVYPLAVLISERELSKLTNEDHFYNLIADLVEACQKHVTFKFQAYKHICISFNDEKIANIFKEKVQKLFNILNSEIKKLGLKFEFEIKPRGIDNWTVSIKVSA